MRDSCHEAPARSRSEVITFIDYRIGDPENGDHARRDSEAFCHLGVKFKG